MSCLIVGSEEENEEESNQTCLGPETLGRWQQNGCVEKTKGRERFKQVTGCKLGCTYLPPQGSHLLVRSTTLKKINKRNTSLSQAVPILVSHSLGPSGIQLFSSVSSVIQKQPLNTLLLLVQVPVQFLSVLKTMPHVSTVAKAFATNSQVHEDKNVKTKEREKIFSCYVVLECSQKLHQSKSKLEYGNKMVSRKSCLSVSKHSHINAPMFSHLKGPTEDGIMWLPLSQFKVILFFVNINLFILIGG